MPTPAPAVPPVPAPVVPPVPTPCQRPHRSHQTCSMNAPTKGFSSEGEESVKAAEGAEVAISIAIPTMPAKTPTEILRENMVTSGDHARSLVGQSWSTRRGFEFGQRIGRILKVGRHLQLRQGHHENRLVRVSPARFGGRWIRFLHYRLVVPRVCSGERIGRGMVCRHNAALGLPLYCSERHSNILRSVDADHDHARRSVMIDKNVFDSSDFFVVHPVH